MTTTPLESSDEPPAPNGDEVGWGGGDVVRFDVDSTVAGDRLDRFLAARFPEQSRSALARAIDRGAARVDGLIAKASCKLRAGSSVIFQPPPPPREGPSPEAIPLSFLFVDDSIAVVDKPAGMVVHPAKGNGKGTLAGALLWHLEGMGDDSTRSESQEPSRLGEGGVSRAEVAGVSRAGGTGLSRAGGPTRPGIVHRLDRDTSGVIIVARTEIAHHQLARQFERRTVEKEYLAITHGAPQFDSDEIDLPIGIHPYQRERMAVRRDHPTARDAVTRYEVIERFRNAALLRVRPRTGRTHQIRVHLAAVGCPVLCDGLYSGRGVIPEGFFSDCHSVEGEDPLLARQALHAASLTIEHPTTRERKCFAAKLPGDLERVLAVLRSRS
ncbi:MAG: RluA family pseudouridine synthase [Planctomycetaceae bacterium]